MNKIHLRALLIATVVSEFWGGVLADNHTPVGSSWGGDLEWVGCAAHRSKRVYIVITRAWQDSYMPSVQKVSILHPGFQPDFTSGLFTSFYQLAIKTLQFGWHVNVYNKKKIYKAPPT